MVLRSMAGTASADCIHRVFGCIDRRRSVVEGHDNDCDRRHGTLCRHHHSGCGGGAATPLSRAHRFRHWRPCGGGRTHRARGRRQRLGRCRTQFDHAVDVRVSAHSDGVRERAQISGTGVAGGPADRPAQPSRAVRCSSCYRDDDAGCGTEGDMRRRRRCRRDEGCQRQLRTSHRRRGSRRCAQHMRALAANRWIVARLGGDEFACIAVGRPADLADRTAELVERLGRARMLSGLTVSVGSAVVPVDADSDVRQSAHDVLRIADSEMYRAKRSRWPA